LTFYVWHLGNDGLKHFALRVPELPSPPSQNFVILWWLNLLRLSVWYLYKTYDCGVFVCTSMVRQVSRIFHGWSWGPDYEAVSNLYLILKSALWKSFRKYMCSCIYIHTNVTTYSMTHWPNLNKKFYSSWFFKFIQDLQFFLFYSHFSKFQYSCLKPISVSLA
jgi:hypothetical protein